MRTLTIAAAASAMVLACGSATAADLRVRAPAAPAAALMAPIYDWSGFYIGLQGGYGWGDLEWTFVGPGTIADHRTRGGLFGGTAGVNMQFGQWVFGIEGDYAWAGIKGTAVCPDPTFDCRSKLESFGTVRGRLGIAWDAFMVYGTGGVAFGDQNIRTVDLITGTVVGSNVFSLGWTAGGGVEWGFAPGWSMKVEALYFDLGTDRYIVAGPDPVDARHHGVIVRGGINWRFNWGPTAPIAARY
jgi:outer membrane immunogenic protein